jgi:hypothetical protein
LNSSTLVIGEDWEGLYINNTLVKEGHSLNEGESRIKYFIQLSKTYIFDLEQLSECYLNDEQNEILNDIGSLPNDLRDFVEWR